MGKLKGKIALITGSAGGIGHGISSLLAEQEAQVIVNYRHSVPGDGHRALQADVSSKVEVARMFARVEAEYGRLDILVNNAGINRDGALDELSEAMWDEVIATNLKGPFLCCQAAAPLMLKTGAGAIINIASESAIRGRAGACNYVAAKAGLIGLTKALAKELAPAIRANCVAVGVVQTAEVMTRMNLHQPERLRHVIAEVPMGRIGTPEDVAQAVLYLASADSSYVTGQVLAVGGGRWMG